ncbi:hypothetical protein CJ030_MR1G027866 [Morella rubra]|uniref:Myb/SANT-like domain-containing protein n=1 Tax=Morella rubra TaxID=262757 RepID=A0A6A1WMF1_9ROSI|nr:hypothetical protein CJ030_MR1G027866 [Morella rubra]
MKSEEVYGMIIPHSFVFRHAIVEELAGLGARVHTCSRNEAELNVCLGEWEKKGFQVTGSACDVSLPAERDKLTSTASSLFNGKLNILINNAGTNKPKTTIDYTAEDFSFLMSTNLESAFHLCQLAYPLLKASGAGSIVFVSSISGQVATPASSIYGATKGGMNQLARSLACEWAKDNIRSNSVAPGLITTPLSEKYVAAGDGKFFNAIMSQTPLGRPGEPKEVASVVAFLCLPAASYNRKLNPREKLKADYKAFCTLKNQTGVSWNQETNTVDADDTWWNQFLSMLECKNKGLANFPELDLLFADNTKTGNNCYSSGHGTETEEEATRFKSANCYRHGPVGRVTEEHIASGGVRMGRDGPAPKNTQSGSRKRGSPSVGRRGKGKMQPSSVDMFFDSAKQFLDSKRVCQGASSQFNENSRGALKHLRRWSLH